MAEAKPQICAADEVLEQSPTAVAPGEIVLGTVTGIDDQGRPLVEYLNNPADKPVAALTTVSITRAHINRQVALLFANGEPDKPVILGLIHSPLYAILEASQVSGSEQAGQEDAQLTRDAATPNLAQVDGERVVIEGQKEIVLRCGESSITLTRTGKILIRGKYLLSRSSGVNRILGGSVQVN